MVGWVILPVRWVVDAAGTGFVWVFFAPVSGKLQISRVVSLAVSLKYLERRRFSWNLLLAAAAGCFLCHVNSMAVEG